MTDYVISAFCLLIALIVLMLRKAYFKLPQHELKRQASRGDQFARLIYPVAVLPSFRALLWLIMATFSSLAVIMFNRKAPLLLGLAAAVTWIWLAFSWIPNRKVTSLNQRVAAAMTPFFMWLLQWSRPAVRQLERIQDHYEGVHTGMYESEDLMGLLQRQQYQRDNRIPKEQLARLSKLVDAEGSKVGQFMLPWKGSMKLSQGELVGPKLLDEMHRSGQTAFAVTASKNNLQVVGVLNRDAVGLHSDDKVGDYMQTQVVSIIRNASLEDALIQFAETTAPMLIVVDKEDEAVGTLTLKEILGVLFADVHLTTDDGLSESKTDNNKQEVEEGAIE